VNQFAMGISGILLGTFSIGFISICLFSKSIGSFSLSRLNMVSYIFYKDVFLFTFVGVALVILNIDSVLDLYFWAITGHVSQESRYYGWLTTLYFLVAFPFGMILSNILFLQKYNNRQTFETYVDKPTRTLFSEKDSIVFFVLLIMSIFAMLCVFYVYYYLERIPLLAAIKGADAAALAGLRTDAKIGFKGVAAVKDILAVKLPPLLSYIVYCYAKSFGGVKYKMLFRLLFFVTFLSLTYNLEKAPFILYLVGFLIVRVVLGERLKVRVVFYWFCFLLLLLAILFVFVMGKGNSAEIIGALAQRVLVAQTAGIFLVFEYFPVQNDFLGFSAVSNLFASLQGEEKLHYGRVLYEHYNYSVVEAGTAGYIVANLVAESWALFGIAGVAILPVWAGFFICTLSNVILKLPKTPIFIGLYSYMALNFSVTGGVSHFIYSLVLLSPVMFVLLIYFISYFIYSRRFL